MREEPRNLGGCFRQDLLVLAVALGILAGCAAHRPAPVVYTTGGRRDARWAMVPPRAESRPSSRSSGRAPAARWGTAPQAENRVRMGEVLAIEHPLIDQHLDTLQNERRNFVQRALHRSGEYLEVMAPILEEEGVPVELAYVPLIESGFDNQAVSPKQAVGPWQFVSETGRRYGLRIDRWVDERRDPEKSTRAAARYLRDLYEMFGTWPLALAAYNTGEGLVGDIVQRQGPMSFWEMRRRGYLYNETGNYVPAVLAAARIGVAPADYGFEAPLIEPRTYDIVETDDSISLREIAELAKVRLREVEELNPALIRGVTPPGPGTYELRLPQGSGQRFARAYAAWRSVGNHRRPADSSVSQHRVADRVRRGDTPASIARRLGVPIAVLIRANGWSNPRRLIPGQPVRVPSQKKARGADTAAAVGGASGARIAARTSPRGSSLY